MATIVDRLYGINESSDQYKNKTEEVLSRGGFHYFSIYTEVGRPDQATDQEAAKIAAGEFNEPPKIFAAVQPNNLKPVLASDSESKLDEIKEDRKYNSIDEMIEDEEKAKELVASLEEKRKKYEKELAENKEKVKPFDEKDEQLRKELLEIDAEIEKLKTEVHINKWDNFSEQDIDAKKISEEEVKQHIDKIEQQLNEAQAALASDPDDTKLKDEIKGLTLKKARLEVIKDMTDLRKQQASRDKSIDDITKEREEKQNQANEIKESEKKLKELYQERVKIPDEHKKRVAEYNKKVQGFIDAEKSEVSKIQGDLSDQKIALEYLESERRKEIPFDEQIAENDKHIEGLTSAIEKAKLENKDAAKISKLEAQLETIKEYRQNLVDFDFDSEIASHKEKINELSKQYEEYTVERLREKLKNDEAIKDQAEKMKNAYEADIARLDEIDEQAEALEDKLRKVIKEYNKKDDEKVDRLEKEIEKLQAESGNQEEYEAYLKYSEELSALDRLESIKESDLEQKEYFIQFYEDSHKEQQEHEDLLMAMKALDVEELEEKLKTADESERADIQKQIETINAEMDQTLKEQADRLENINNLKKEKQEIEANADEAIKKQKEKIKKAKVDYDEPIAARERKIKEKKETIIKLQNNNFEHVESEIKKTTKEANDLSDRKWELVEEIKKKRNETVEQLKKSKIDPQIEKINDERQDIDLQKKENGSKKKKIDLQINKLNKKITSINNDIRYITDPEYRKQQQEERKKKSGEYFDNEIAKRNKQIEENEKALEELIKRQRQGEDVEDEIQNLKNKIAEDRDAIDDLNQEKEEYRKKRQGIDTDNLDDGDPKSKKLKDQTEEASGKKKDEKDVKGFAIGIPPFQMANMRFMYYHNMSYELYVGGQVSEGGQTGIGVGSTGEFILKPRFDAFGGALGGKFLIGADEDIFLEFNAGIEIISKQVARVRVELGGGMEDKLELYGSVDLNWVDQRYVGEIRGIYNGGGVCVEANINIDIDLKNEIFRTQIGSRDNKIYVYIYCADFSKSVGKMEVSAEAGVGFTGWIDVLFDKNSKLATSEVHEDYVDDSISPPTLEAEIGFGVAAKAEARGEMWDLVLAFVTPYAEVRADAGLKFRIKLAPLPTEVEGGLFLDLTANAGANIIWKVTDKRENLSLFSVSGKADGNFKAILSGEKKGYYISGKVVGEASILSLPPATVELPFETKL